MKNVMTVLGARAPETLGVVMPHEHIICEANRHSGKEDNLLNDVTTACAEVALFKQAGGGTICDVTPADLGRDPMALKRIAETTGVHIITSTGYYDEKLYPDHVTQQSVDSLAAWMVSEAVEGINDTGIKPGLIGELRSSATQVTPAEARILKAAAGAHHETGLAITLHSGFGRPGPNQVAVLRGENVSPERIIVGHADLELRPEIAEDLDYFLPLLDAGCYLAFDTIGWDEFCPDAERIRRIALLLERGYGRQLLLSSDICRRSFYHVNGGRGYDYVLKEFVPRLKKHGIADDLINAMLIENPVKALAF